MAKPEIVLVPHEDFECTRFSLVGQYGDGNQFMAFVTGAFPQDWWGSGRSPEYLRNHWPEHKRWYAVLHRFGPDGEHLGTDARSGGTTAEGEDAAIDRANKELEAMLASVTPFHPCDIRVKPFGIETDGYLFGLVYRIENAEDPNDPERILESVTLEPNDIIFHPPWDTGEYST
jgi:formate hydrogenlyase regulatory protein HycA